MEDIERQSFKIISNVGAAKSLYIEAIKRAEDRDFEGAYAAIKEGEKSFLLGHEAHAELLQEESEGKISSNSMLLIHAEDQLMSAEDFKIIANQFIRAYKTISKLENK